MSTAEKLLDPKQEHQIELEELYDKHQLFPRVREAFRACTKLDFAGIMKQADILEKFGFDLLAQMAVRKRADVPTLVGCLRHHYEDSQETAQMLERAVAVNLVEWSERDKQFIVIYEISKRLQRELDRFQFPLPMVVQPSEVKTNLDTGYLTQKGSVILRDNHHEDDVCLDHLNRMNRLKLALNLDVAKTIQNKWRNLDRKKPNETWEDFKKRRKAFEKYDLVAKDVIELLTQEGNELYLTHRYDKRGRTYCMGHHVTYQGTDWNKAVLELGEKEKLEE